MTNIALSTEQSNFVETTSQILKARARQLIELGRSLAEIRITATCKQLKEILRQISLETGYKIRTLLSYAKLGKWLDEVPIDNLVGLDEQTLKALCCNSFKTIINALKEENLTTDEVQSVMKEIKARSVKLKEQAVVTQDEVFDSIPVNVVPNGEQDEVSDTHFEVTFVPDPNAFIKNVNGDRFGYLEIRDEQAIADLSQQVEKDGKSAPYIVCDAIKLRLQVQNGEWIRTELVEEVVSQRLLAAAPQDEVEEWIPGTEVEIIHGDYKGMMAALSEYKEKYASWWVYLDGDTTRIRLLYKKEHLRLRSASSTSMNT